VDWDAAPDNSGNPSNADEGDSGGGDPGRREAVTVAAISVLRPAEKERHFDPVQWAFLDSFQSAWGQFGIT
jgi:hypothetical protein